METQIITLGGSFERPVRNAKSVWTGRRGVILRLRGDGLVGIGEASPLPNYSPDRIGDCQRYLNALKIEQVPQSLEDIRNAISDIPKKLPAARFAVETALLDLLSQRRGCAISALLSDTIEESASRCGLLSGDTDLSSAEALLARGLGTAKLKVGRSWPEELRHIKELLSKYPALKLRIDVNGQWTVHEALANMADLADTDIEFVEQPVAPNLMAQLGSAPCPIAADESLRSEAGCKALEVLAESCVLAAIVLKPNVLGGALACMKLHSWALERGVQSIASHCFDGPVGTAAVAELAVATAGRFAAGVDAHDALSAWPPVRIPQLATTAIHSHSPGLGVAL